METLAGTHLRSLQELVLGSRIHVFGTVAIAAVACENIENESTTERVVEMMLLVKQDGRWRIAAQAWDKETPANPIPTDLQPGNS